MRLSGRHRALRLVLLALATVCAANRGRGRGPGGSGIGESGESELQPRPGTHCQLLSREILTAADATTSPPTLAVHPLHFLYAKFHADIAPIGGHDGYGEPSANGDFHYLHHHKFECNYGVPFPINFDKIFGSYVDFEEFKANGGKLPASLKAE